MPRKCAPLAAIPSALEKTGFLLEYDVAQEFRKSGWTTIGGRYYLDDVSGQPRELDLIAYKVKVASDVEIFSCVLVSCKKDSENTWAFLSTDRPPFDANFDWDPVHLWTDCEPLASYLASEAWKDKYVKGKLELKGSAFGPTRNIFALQLISPDGGAPRNDKPIFDSIASLMKALDHEIAALPSRQKGKKRIYVFSLLAVVDAPMVDVQYRDKIGTAIEIAQLLHLARLMVRRRDLAAHVHFVRSDLVKDFVGTLSELADYNAAYFERLAGESYGAIRTSNKVRSYFAKWLDIRLRWRLNGALERLGYRSENVEELHLSYEDNKLVLELNLDEDRIDALNGDDEIRTEVQSVLRSVARYEGAFEFAEMIPF